MLSKEQKQAFTLPGQKKMISLFFFKKKKSHNFGAYYHVFFEIPKMKLHFMIKEWGAAEWIETMNGVMAESHYSKVPKYSSWESLGLVIFHRIINSIQWKVFSCPSPSDSNCHHKIMVDCVLFCFALLCGMLAMTVPTEFLEFPYNLWKR